MKKNSVLLLYMCFFTCFQASAQTPALHFSYDEENGTTTAVESVSGLTFPIRNNFNRPERIAGIAGNALRLDGFSTWVEASSARNYKKHFTLEAWVILESFPSDAEVPFANLSPSAFISQTNGNTGFQLGINTFGHWYFRVNINGILYTCPATGLFPLYQWVHVAAVVDGDQGQLTIYLNGTEAGAASFPSPGEMSEAAVPLLIGKSNTDKRDGIFLLNALNGAMDETKFYDQSLTGATILQHYQAGASQASTLGAASLQVPAERFAPDLQRPLFHALPPANWTNEPHGLVKHNGQYHLFYQRTPNGPFKTQMHWGHLVSKDLVSWINTKDALRPGLEWSPTAGYDMKGIWSGDVLMQENKAYAFYTNVNHSGSYNPGIALATSADPDLETWQKHGPVISKEQVNDFRDPFLWQEGNTWHMIIGAALKGGGGLAYYTSADLLNWTFKPGFTSIPYSQMDIGSAIWEMPVFESLGNGKYVLVVNPIGGSIGKYGPDKYTRAVYWTGTWQNGQFTPDYAQPKMLDILHGHLSPTIEKDYNNNLVGIGIVDERRSSQAQLTAGWAHLFSLPRAWYLLPDRKTLGQKPLPDLVNIREPGTYKKLGELRVDALAAMPDLAGTSTELLAYVDTTATGTRYGINLRISPGREEITSLYYDTQLKKVFLDKTRSSLSAETEEKVVLCGNYDVKAFGKPYKIQVFMDHSVIDVFINDAAAFSNRIYPTLPASAAVELFSQGGTTTFTSLEKWAMAAGGPPPPAPAVTGVALANELQTIPAGHKITLFAAVQPAHAANKKITWSSANTAVATVDTAGTVTALAPGTATITATTLEGGYTAQSTVTVLASGPPDYRRYDFEQGTLSDLIVSGQAFSAADVAADNDWGWGGPFHQQGQKHLWGFKQGGDGQAGALRTPDFVLGGDGKITFLLGGGKNLNTLYVALVRASDQVVLMKTTGLNDEAYAPKMLDAGKYVGVTCYVHVVDQEGGAYGHLNLDNLVIPLLDQQVTGIKTGQQLPGQHQIRAYPVPTGEIFTLDLTSLKKEQAKVALFDLQGKKVQTFDVKAGRLVNLPVKGILKRGQVYLVRITTSAGSFTRKIISQ
jgi:beta-fructofuranosidase